MFSRRRPRYQTPTMRRAGAPASAANPSLTPPMASIPIVLLAALAAAVFFSCLGTALARWIRPAWAPPLGLAPVLGWGVFSAISFSLQSLLGFSRLSTALLVALALAASVAALVLRRNAVPALASRLPLWGCGLAAMIALIPLSAILPKYVPGGVILASPMFDHSKVAMVDEMARLGLPAGNPFFGLDGARGSLSYYYLWHFAAAQLSVLAGVTGWEADAAMTGFTGYASVMLMMSLAARLSHPDTSETERPQGRIDGRRPAVAVLATGLFSLTGSLRPMLNLVLGKAGVSRVLAHYPSLAGWVVQSSWVPQHMMSACCVVLAVLMMAELMRAPRLSAALLAGAMAAAGFGSSAYVGGVTFAIAALALAGLGIVCAPPGRRLAFLIGAGAAAIVAFGLALPFVMGELVVLRAHLGGSQIRLHPYEVVGSIFPQPLRRVLDYPAYWMWLLPLDLTAIYPAGMAAMVLFVRRAARRSVPDVHVLSLAVLTVCSLGVTWLLASSGANNDLGWRAMLPAVLALTGFAAGGVAGWLSARAWLALGAALLLFALSVPDRQILLNIKGRPTPEAARFADAVEMWSDVRRYAGPTDRVADNPLLLMTMTNLPVNPSWALLSDRPSCYSGWETARVYVDFPAERINDLDDQFVNVFAGSGSEDDVRQMATQYGCRVVALAASDGAWDDDPFADSPDYRLAEERRGKWRIYVATVPLKAPLPAGAKRLP